MIDSGRPGVAHGRPTSRGRPEPVEALLIRPRSVRPASRNHRRSCGQEVHPAVTTKPDPAGNGVYRPFPGSMSVGFGTPVETGGDAGGSAGLEAAVTSELVGSRSHHIIRGQQQCSATITLAHRRQLHLSIPKSAMS
jgi:hypothetical protein